MSKLEDSELEDSELEGSEIEGSEFKDNNSASWVYSQGEEEIGVNQSPVPNVRQREIWTSENDSRIFQELNIQLPSHNRANENLIKSMRRYVRRNGITNARNVEERQEHGEGQMAAYMSRKISAKQGLAAAIELLKGQTMNQGRKTLYILALDDIQNLLISSGNNSKQVLLGQIISLKDVLSAEQDEDTPIDPEILEQIKVIIQRYHDGDPETNQYPKAIQAFLSILTERAKIAKTAAVKISSVYRGHKVRKNLRTAKNAQNRANAKVRAAEITKRALNAGKEASRAALFASFGQRQRKTRKTRRSRR